MLRTSLRAAGHAGIGQTMGRRAMPMTDVVLAGFRGALKSLDLELPVMPLSRWNESVLRWHFCRAVAIASPGTQQFVECGKIDLVLAQDALRAFVEFKFYWQPRRFDPYGRAQAGFKGGPSLKNVREFESCVNQMAERASRPGLSKYIVLVYADRADGGPSQTHFSDHYDQYQHQSIRLVEMGNPIAGGEGIVRAKLFEVEAAHNAVRDRR
jgi:hypothetical protein